MPERKSSAGRAPRHRGRRLARLSRIQENRARSSCFRILSVALRGSASTTSSCSGIFCAISPAARQSACMSATSSGVAPGRGHHHRADAFAAAASGSPITATAATFGCACEQVLDLLGADVLALADDHVLARPVSTSARRRERAEIAGAEEAVGVEASAVSAASV